MKWWFRRHRGLAMPHRFEELAVFNAEEWRGIHHTTEHAARMAELQRDFDEWSAGALVAQEKP